MWLTHLSTFIGADIKNGLDKSDNTLLYCPTRALCKMKQRLYNTTFIIHMFHVQVASSLIQANYGCNTLESGWWKHDWREERSRKDRQKSLQRQCNLQQAALDNREACLQS